MEFEREATSRGNGEQSTSPPQQYPDCETKKAKWLPWLLSSSGYQNLAEQQKGNSRKQIEDLSGLHELDWNSKKRIKRFQALKNGGSQGHKRVNNAVQRLVSEVADFPGGSAGFLAMTDIRKWCKGHMVLLLFWDSLTLNIFRHDLSLLPEQIINKCSDFWMWPIWVCTTVLFLSGSVLCCNHKVIVYCVL